MKEAFTNVLTGTLVACALITTVSVVRRDLVRDPEPASAPRPVKVDDWRRLAEGGTFHGPPNAPVIITEFADFQCPYCKRFAENLRGLERKYPGQIALSFRHFPLDNIHPHARAAAYAAECAHRQGKFRGMHDALLEDQQSIGLLEWAEFGRRAGVADLDRFQACLKDPAVANRVEADRTLGLDARVRGTPTVYLNRWRLGGTPSAALMDSIVQTLLAEEAGQGR